MSSVRTKIRVRQGALLATCLGGSSLGCGGADIQAKVNAQQPQVNAQVNDTFAEVQKFNDAVKYERWDDAVALAEATCGAIDSAPEGTQRANKRRTCLNRRYQAYDGRALASAKASQWDAAVRDEILAQKATADLPGADAEYVAAVNAQTPSMPDIARQQQAGALADATMRERRTADSRVEKYQAHLLPDYFFEATGRATPAALLAAATPPPIQPAPPPGGLVAQTMPSSSSGFVSAAPQAASYAFIIGVERYRDVPAATGAHSDAVRFGRLMRETLGLKDSHIRITLDDHATRSDILGGLQWLAANAPPGGRIYFYFSGHGVPAADQSSYLLPYDGDPKDVVDSAVPMSDVMAKLGSTKAHEVLAVLDSCFSGAGGRSVLPPGARPLMRVKDVTAAPQLAMFTASGGDEISGLAPGELNGLFTKFVTQGLGTAEADTDGDGQISLQELSDWVGPRVARDAMRDHREQHPKLVVGSGLGTPSSFMVEYGLPTK
jgi:Caspase domain